MKLIKQIIKILYMFFGVLLIIGVILNLIHAMQLDFDISTKGFKYFINSFNSLKEIFTITIALLSVHFILFQIENISKSNARAIYILENEIRDKTLELSQLFYINIYSQTHEIIKEMESINNYLISQEWDTNDFDSYTLEKQNSKWKVEFKKLPTRVINNIEINLNQLESLSATILNTNIDEKLAYKLFGIQFLRLISNLYPFISIYRFRYLTEETNFYSNIFKVFKKWDEIFDKNNKNGL